MAGGFGGPQHSTKKQSKNFSSEVLKDSQYDTSPQKSPAKFSLQGILGLGQTVEINKNTQSTEKQNHELFYGLSHLVKEQNILFDQHQKELTKELQALREEISKLIHSTSNLEKDVANIALAEIPEVSEYQLNFLSRIRIFIATVRKNISTADIWLEAFAAKKKKKNLFWNNVKNKKKGGEQYLFSNEHSAARSAN
jgi:hypothetical protein